MREENGARGGQRLVRLHGKVAGRLGLDILSGRLRPGDVLEGEILASERLAVSRTVYREALKILVAKGLIHSRPRTGTRVSEVAHWHLLDPDLLAWLFSEPPRPEVLHGLFELRMMIEPEAAALAAVRHARADLERMCRALDDMARHTLSSAEGRAADTAFHSALLVATQNPFIVSLVDGITAAVNALTLFKLGLAKIGRDAVPDHVRVYDAIAAKDAQAARAAMDRLIRLAILDVPAERRPQSAGTGSQEQRVFP